jgi:hypothetical protein
MAERDDRRVHASYPGMEIVRYDRRGKWFLEPTDRRLKPQRVRVYDAAKTAVWGEQHDGRICLGLPGGQTFDRNVASARKIDAMNRRTADA